MNPPFHTRPVKSFRALCSMTTFACGLVLTSCGDSAPVAPPTAQTPVVVATPRPAAADFAQQKSCLACHTARAKMVGPAWATIAEKYKGDKDAVEKLTAKVLNGGSGVYSNVVMPAQAGKVTAEDAKYLVEWVLTQK